MKEKINSLAKGIFEYQAPAMVITPENLHFSVEAGEIYQGSFVVSNDKKRTMKGVVCSDCHNLVIRNEDFYGEENEISFIFRGTYLTPGEVVRGSLQILSDCGSLSLPFAVSVTAPSCEGKSGKVGDLAQFTNLAKENLTEAVRLFNNPRFARIFLEQDVQQQGIYEGLLENSDRHGEWADALALEEFLIAVRKKVPVQLSAAKTELQYPDCEKKFSDKIVLKKDTWGFCEYSVTSDAAFLRVEHSCVRTKDFVGDSYPLLFVVDPEMMAEGHNFARITISNARQTLEIKVIARKFCVSDEERKKRIREQKDAVQLFHSYLMWRGGKRKEKEYIDTLEKLIGSMETLPREERHFDWMSSLFRIQLGILKSNVEAVSAEMSRLRENLEQLYRQQPVLYCGYYYFLAKWKQDEEVKQESLRQIRKCYQERDEHWLIAWFLMELDQKFSHPNKREGIMLELLRQGVASPLLYLELCLLYNENPGLLLELDEVRIQSLHWGCKNDILSEELQFRYAYLIGRKRHFSRLLLEDLCRLYEKNPEDDILTVICQMLMKDRRISPEDCKWYEMGIEHNLKLTELYEYYMYALEESPEMKLPDKVLLYFTYDNHLNAAKKAMLYAYIVRRKTKDRKTYDTYRETMERFARQQLLEGHINQNLAVLYEEFINEENLNREMAEKLPNILFAREITCNNPDIVGAVVRHRELVKEEYFPLVKGKATVFLYTESAQVFLVDRDGNRYCQSISYTMDRLLQMGHLAKKCLKYAGDNYRLLLHLYEKADRENKNSREIVELRQQLIGLNGLSEEYWQKIFGSLMRYYFEHFEGELLDAWLERMDWDRVAPGDREQLVEYCAVRHCYDKGMEGIMQFGYEHISAKRLLKLSANTFEKGDLTEEPKLIKLAWYIFKQGQFDENLLRYLCDYYSGTVSQVIQIWKAAEGFGMDVTDFSERILAQMVFTGDIIPEGYPVFYQYYEKGFNKRLIRAFLKLSGYNYLVHGQSVPQEIFDYFYKDVRLEDNLPCLLAVLQHMSEKKQLSGEERVFADYNIHQLYEKEIVLGFYQNFAGQISLPEKIMREQYIEYIADPAREVFLEYRINTASEKGNWERERMKDVFEGIRVRGIVLFEDETMEYCIIEILEDGSEKRSPQKTLSYVNRGEQVGSWYHLLNQMMFASEQSDMDSLTALMREYVDKRQIVDQLFTTYDTEE